ncbi:MAG: sulfate adenylyltransferase, partial [Nitrospinota bacterium]
MKDTIAPHGGKLVNRIAEDKERETLEEKIPNFKKIKLNKREISDLEMIATGGLSPLEGFMLKKDYDSVVDVMHLSNGLSWTIPITLSATEEEVKNFKEGEDIALEDENGGEVLGILHLEEKYRYDKEKEADQVYGTLDTAHPGVAYLYQTGNILLGGKISLIKRPRHTNFMKYRFAPSETRKIFREKGWRRVVGFQTRNPIHRAHEYIQKCALE